MRKLFEVPNDAETRLWKLDGKDSFTRLRCLGKTATEAGLESILRSPTLVLETKIDGSETRCHKLEIETRIKNRIPDQKQKQIGNNFLPLFLSWKLLKFNFLCDIKEPTC